MIPTANNSHIRFNTIFSIAILYLLFFVIMEYRIVASPFPVNKISKENMPPTVDSKALPLLNQTIWGVLSAPVGDFFRPGAFNLQQSSLPLFVVLFNVIGNVIAFIIFLYFWKEIYYQVPDPYATEDGPAPPQLKSDELNNIALRVMEAIKTLG